jgi:predicted RNA-binding Zn-ribbon protein involved in translation (DUF1610 family)
VKHRPVLHGIVVKPPPPRSCPNCGTRVTRSTLGRWSCASCGWKGLTPAPSRIIYLDPRERYECPRCHNAIHPKVEETASEEKDQRCPKCHLVLPHDLKPLSAKLLATSVTQLKAADPLAPPKCFVSYSWDSSTHEDWVLNLATQLRKQGIDVVLDKWDLKFGNDLPHFMETSVRESDFVLLICTPRYAKKANAGKGGAGYEKRIVTGEMFKNANESKFIPLMREGTDEDSLPTFLQSRIYIDFRNDADFDVKLKDLLHQLHGVPKHPKPTLGPSPFTSQQGQQGEPRRTATGFSGLPPPLDQILGLPQARKIGHGEVRPLKNKLDVKGIDPKYSGITIIHMPLNLRPDLDWTNFFSNPTTWTPSVHKALVAGDHIVVRANSDRIEEDLKWIYSYIDQANESYRKFIIEKEQRLKREQEAEEKREKERRELAERLRKV